MAMNRDIKLMGDDGRLFSPYEEAKRMCHQQFREEVSDMQKVDKEKLLTEEGISLEDESLTDDQLLSLVVDRVITKKRGGSCHRKVFFELCETFGPNNSASDCQLKKRSGLEIRRLQRWIYLTPYLLDGKEELYVGHGNNNSQYYATRPLDVIEGKGETSVVSYLLSDEWKPKGMGEMKAKERRNLLLFMSMFKDVFKTKFVVQWSAGTFRRPSQKIKDSTPFQRIIPENLGTMDEKEIKAAVDNLNLNPEETNQVVESDGEEDEDEAIAESEDEAIVESDDED